MHLKEVDHEDIQILFEYGKYTIHALLAEVPLKVYQEKLKKFVEKFEDRFLALLSDWTGSMNEFQVAIDLVENIFEWKKKPLSTKIES